MILLHAQPGIGEMLLILIVLGFAGGILTSLFYAILIMFFPEKKVKFKDIMMIMGIIMCLFLGYFIFLLTL